VKAIETVWKGYRFRSRLEARWAVFFTSLGVKWEYEPEGYELEDGTKYLPDFWLPNEQVWVEVKGKAPTNIEALRCGMLADESGMPVVMVCGTPGYEPLSTPGGVFMEPTHIERIFLGYNPPPPEWRVFEWSNALEDREGATALEEFLVNNGLIQKGVRFDSGRDRVKFLIETDRQYFRNKYGREHHNWRFGIESDPSIDGLVLIGGRLASGSWGACEKMVRAANAARSARFEHGEVPA